MKLSCVCQVSVPLTQGKGLGQGKELAPENNAGKLELDADHWSGYGKMG